MVVKPKDCFTQICSSLPLCRWHIMTYVMSDAKVGTCLTRDVNVDVGSPLEYQCVLTPRMFNDLPHAYLSFGHLI